RPRAARRRTAAHGVHLDAARVCGASLGCRVPRCACAGGGGGGTGGRRFRDAASRLLNHLSFAAPQPPEPARPWVAFTTDGTKSRPKVITETAMIGHPQAGWAKLPSRAPSPMANWSTCQTIAEARTHAWPRSNPTRVAAIQPAAITTSTVSARAVAIEVGSRATRSISSTIARV